MWHPSHHPKNTSVIPIFQADELRRNILKRNIYTKFREHLIKMRPVDTSGIDKSGKKILNTCSGGQDRCPFYGPVSGPSYADGMNSISIFNFFHSLEMC